MDEVTAAVRELTDEQGVRRLLGALAQVLFDRETEARAECCWRYGDKLAAARQHVIAAQGACSEGPGPQDPTAIKNALLVIVQDRLIRRWLVTHDPQALMQAEAALGMPRGTQAGTTRADLLARLQALRTERDALETEIEELEGVLS